MSAELLAPAGNAETARAALLAGADAVYAGLDRFSARAAAENFSLEALEETARFAHLLGAKIYVCLNTLVRDCETDDFFDLARKAWNAGADALLLQDIFLGRALKNAYPEMELHLSTQGGCCNVYGAEVAAEYGFSRVVLARETALEDIARISERIQTEAFVQGALCACFSGQCYLSSFAGNQSGNRGRCKQPCRKRYSIDRKGFSEKAYALSVSDLCVGEKTAELLRAGVGSLKIEGRMRRPEYVAAAVKYYRAVLDGGETEEAFSRMKRAYNRGDYTQGIAFGEKNFLSRNVQGHIGEEVGRLSFVGGRPFCESAFPARAGDGFKLLRGGKEVGGARCVSRAEGGFFLSSPERLRAGDSVRITTDSAANELSLAPVKKKKIEISVRIMGGEYPRVQCGELIYTGTERAERAKSAPLDAEEIRACFLKTDGLPLSPAVTAETENAFFPKSALNALRREFYAEFVRKSAPLRAPLPEKKFSASVVCEKGNLTAAISAGKRSAAQIAIVRDVSQGAEKAERFLYLPPYFTGADEKEYAESIKQAGGIYCDGYYAIALARKYGVPLFAGTGFHLCNAFGVQGVLEAGAKYFALSKEISCAEQRALAAKGAFALSAGAVKVMDLAFCPFGRTCGDCDRREFYTMTDEDGRSFPLRRYGRAGRCRFEVYNCLPLASYNGVTSALVDCTLSGGKDLAEYAFEPARAFEKATGGHGERSMQ